MNKASRFWIFSFFGLMVLFNAGLSWFAFIRPQVSGEASPTWAVVGYLLATLLVGAALALVLARVIYGHSLSRLAHIDVSGESCQRMVYVGADSFREGRTGGDMLGELLQGRGEVALVTGLTGQSLDLRKSGFFSILEEKYPQLAVVAEVEGKGDLEGLYAKVINLCRDYPNLAGIYVVDGGSPAVVARAIKAAGRAQKIKLVCHDLVDETMHALVDGTITGTISQDPFAQGHDPVIYLYNYLVAAQRPPRAKMITQVDRITRENYQFYWDPQRGAVETAATQSRRVRPVSQRPERPLRIIVLGREDVTFFDAVKQGALAAAAELKDCNTIVEWVEPERARRRRRYDALDYGPSLEAYRLKKYDGIVVPIYDKALVPFINRVVQSGIPVATYNSEPENLNSLTTTLVAQARELRDISVVLAKSATESGERANQINQSIGAVNQSLSQEAQSAGEAIVNVQQIAKAIDNISQGAKEQTQAAGSVAAAIDGISGAVAGTNQTALVSEQTAEQASSIARQGAQTIQQTLKQIEEIRAAVTVSAEKIHALNQLSQQIDVIVSTVSDMAEQTNLLALNANIEAARAGENGHGFAVVATEIRNLAEQSKQSTKEIASLIRAVQRNSKEMVQAADAAMQQAQAGGDLASQAGQALDALLKAAETMRVQTEKVVQANAGVVENLKQLTNANQLVTAVTVENASATQQVRENVQHTVRMVNHINGISKENASAIEEVHIRSDEVASQSQRLKGNISMLVRMAEEMQGAVAAFKISQNGKK